MVSIAVMAILVTIAAGGFEQLMLNLRMSARVNDMMADLALARSEAIKRGRTVILCPRPENDVTGTCAGTNWTNGWIVFVDDDGNDAWDNNVAERAIKVREAVKPCPNVAASGRDCTIEPTNVPTLGGISYLRYRPTGISRTTGNTQVFMHCDGRLNNRGRRIDINLTGRAVVRPWNC